MDFLVFFQITANGKVFWEPNKIKTNLVPFFKLQGFWCFLLPFPLWIFAANFGGVHFLVFPCESWCARVSEEIFRISDPAAPNDEILHDLFGLLIYCGYLEGVYTQYIAYHGSSFINEYSITNPDTKFY